MIDTKTLSIKDKISLLNKLYEELSGHGIGGDTELAHINPWEADLLRSVGGAGTVNEVTGLRQYLGGGGSSSPPPQPTQTTSRQVPEYAPEQREYITDIFGKSQELYEQRTAEGFQPFPGTQLAPFAAQEQEAFSGIESLARGPGAAPAFEIARTASLGAAAPITAAEIQQGMNPYQQAVTDIAKREAARQYQRGPQAQLRTGAVESGGLRGARRFIEESEGQRNLQQQMSDIQTMGSQQAYNQAMAEAAAARGRLANLATQMPSIGTGAYQQQLAQYGQLGGVGEAQRAQQQAAIDLAQSQFQREQMFPEETLATYLRFITNAPSPSGFQQTTQRPGVPGPSSLTQLTSGLAGGATLGKAFGLFNRGGAVPPASGRQAGLSGIVRRAGGGQIVRMQDGRSIAQKYAEAYGYPERTSTTPYEPIEILTPPLKMSDFPAAGAASVVTAEQGQEIVDRRLMEDIAKGSVQGGDIYLDMPDLLEEEKPAAEKPAGKAASFRLLPPAEAKPTETKSAFLSGLDNLSTGDLLKLSGAFFQAGSQGSTGNPFGDLTQFLGSAGVTAGDVINEAEKRKLAAEDKKFLLGLKEREVKAAENKGTAALLAVGKDKGEFTTPTTKDLEFTKAILQDGPYKKVSDAAVRQISQIQKKYDKYSPQEIAAMLQASGALVVDDTGFWSFIGGGTPTLQTAGE
jgi:hypothetical protein